jgi:hypothetical protein
VLDRHFAPGLHEEILEAFGISSSEPRSQPAVAIMAFRAAVLEAYLAECWV